MIRSDQAVALNAVRIQAARFGEHRFQRELRVGDDAQVGLEDAADLRRFDIDVDEAPVAAVRRQIAGVAAGETRADRAHHVALEEQRVRERLARLDADDARVQRMVFVDRAFAHQRRRHRELQVLGERDQRFPRLAR